MAQAKRDRVFAAFGSELIEKGLDRKDVALRAECSERGGTDRHGGETMRLAMPRRKIIKRNRVAVGTAAGARRRIDGDGARKGRREFGCRPQCREIGGGGPRGVGVTPDRVARA